MTNTIAAVCSTLIENFTADTVENLINGDLKRRAEGYEFETTPRITIAVVGDYVLVTATATVPERVPDALSAYARSYAAFFSSN